MLSVIDDRTFQRLPCEFTTIVILLQYVFRMLKTIDESF